MENFIPSTLKLGEFLVYSAFLLSLLGLILSLTGKNLEYLRKIEIFVFSLVFLACFTLVSSLVNGHYFIKFVANHSNSFLPLVYKITALWGGQEGSILFWTLVMSFQSVISGKKRHTVSYTFIFLTLSFFLFLSSFLAKPFSFMYPPPEDGRELNPLLQHFGMVLHPVFLYMGLTGTLVSFVFFVERLLGFDTKYRTWAVWNWAFLTLGIVIGGWWAYSELGWGGYWAWDPVENVSFIPWLSLTSFIHISMFERKFHYFQIFSFVLIALTFILSMVGTFLVRSGLFISVHSFVQNPELGIAFLVFIAISTAFCTYIGMTYKPFGFNQKSKKFELRYLVSREFFMLSGVLILLVMLITVLFGTIFPVVLESFTGEKITFGKPFYNKSFGPLAVILLLFMILGGVIPWGNALWFLKKNIIHIVAPFVISFTLVFVFYSSFSLSLVVGLSVAGIYLIFLHALRRKDKALRKLVQMSSHVGLFVFYIGVAFSQLMYKEKEVFIKPNEEISFGNYTIKFKDLENYQGKNFTAVRAVFSVSDNGKQFDISSEKRIYFTWEEPTTEAGIKYGLLKDFYIVFVKPGEDGGIYVKVWDNPLISFVWIGTFIMFASGIFNFLWLIKKEADDKQSKV
ncbi:MAG: cytochrome c biogenesis protein CcsA [Candidatus Calescibacterium sp.]|nr:cytochrome c biogenesis protein CcsA [Candidatus Calescibacterium sp.]MCX7734859.1 cytochrome c biogenesis protein CcsA [bacterium]MDW8087988.1 cytochrome c-type biogenesis CcmF C-terminal domain-containing protein [Candidatus Calescibacterium sp.]